MLGEDHQAFGLGHDLRRLPDLRGAGIGGRGLHLGRAIQPFGGGRLAQNLSWQADMDWTEWSRSGDDPNAVGNLGHLFRKAQFIVPFAGLAYRRRLIAHLLAPSATPTEPAPFGGRCPARVQQRGPMFDRGVDGLHGAIGKAHVGMRHHRL